MEHLDHHPCAFLNKDNIVFYVLTFENHDESLLEQVKNYFNMDKYISCCDYGVACVDGDFYNNKFYAKKPYNSWIRNTDLGRWDAPVSKPEFDPENPKFYIWIEEMLNWQEMSE
jgi:hypothetical protein